MIKYVFKRDIYLSIYNMKYSFVWVTWKSLLQIVIIWIKTYIVREIPFDKVSEYLNFCRSYFFL